jgi:hypothetical protein
MKPIINIHMSCCDQCRLRCMRRNSSYVVCGELAASCGEAVAAFQVTLQLSVG